MLLIGRRAKRQPPPPHILFEALTHPDRDPARPWLRLLHDEVPPEIQGYERGLLVEWTSIWTRRPDALIHFDITAEREGSVLTWRLFVDEPAPDPALTGHMCKRLNELINADLRFTFGQ